MVKTICKSGILLATALIAIAAVGVPVANAQLAATAFGFPQIFHNAETTAFNRDILNQIDNEAVNINFGPGGIGPGGFGCGFPSISQTVNKASYAESTNFYHTEETDAIGYPFVATGTAVAGLPCLGGMPYGGCSGYSGWC